MLCWRERGPFPFCLSSFSPLKYGSSEGGGERGNGCKKKGGKGGGGAAAPRGVMVFFLLHNLCQEKKRQKKVDRRDGETLGIIIFFFFSFLFLSGGRETLGGGLFIGLGKRKRETRITCSYVSYNSRSTKKKAKGEKRLKQVLFVVYF